MKKNDVFTFTAPNGVEVTGVALYAVTLFDGDCYVGNTWFCYAQNRLFSIREFANGEYIYQDTIVEYAVLPDYDRELEDFTQFQQEKECGECSEYPQWEQNLEAKIQGHYDK